MEYTHLQTAISALQQAIEQLQQLTPESSELSALAVADGVQAQVRTALAALSTAVNPQIPEYLSGSLLQQLEDMGIPLDDLEVRAALVAHHPSQVVGVLNEIADRYAEIRRRREYFLVRLPEQPVEELGSRLPFYRASDFAGTPAPTPPEQLAALKRKYHLDRLPKKRPPQIVDRLAAAQQEWEAARAEADPPP
jgi:hypothetical protein